MLVPNVTISLRTVVRAKPADGRALRKASISAVPYKFSVAPKRTTCGDSQNSSWSTGTLFATNAASYRSDTAVSSARTAVRLMSESLTAENGLCLTNPGNPGNRTRLGNRFGPVSMNFPLPIFDLRTPIP